MTDPASSSGSCRCNLLYAVVLLYLPIAFALQEQDRSMYLLGMAADANQPTTTTVLPTMGSTFVPFRLNSAAVITMDWRCHIHGCIGRRASKAPVRHSACMQHSTVDCSTPSSSSLTEFRHVPNPDGCDELRVTPVIYLISSSSLPCYI